MYCPNCGKELKDDDKFCPSCGRAISTRTASEEKPQQQEKQPVNPYQNYPGTQSHSSSPTNPFAARENEHQYHESYIAVQNNKRYALFSKVGFIIACVTIALFVLMFALSISTISDATNMYYGNSNNVGSIVGKLAWVGILYIAEIILGILGIIFSALGVSKPNDKRGLAIAGLIMSSVITFINLILIISSC